MVTETFANNLLLTLILGPMVCGGVCLLMKPVYTRFIFYIHFGIHVICLLTLPFVQDVAFPEPVSFFGHPITFTISTTSTMIALLTVTALFLMMLINYAQDRIPLTRFQAATISIALSAGSVAFFSGQFMIRYIALEFVGLMIAVSVLHLWESRFRAFTHIFVLLRLGDLALLSAILLLAVRAGSLDIASMIETATQLPLPDQAWILGGFIAAILFKLAIFPLDAWWVRFAQETSSLKYWIGTVLMPALGLYLLIRVAPLIHSNTVLTYSTTALAVILMAAAYAFNRGEDRDFYQRANSLLGCFTLIFAAFMPYLILRGYVIAVLGFRIFSVLQPQLSERLAKWGTYGLLVGINVVALFFTGEEASFFFMVGWSILTVIFWVWVFAQTLDWKFSYEPAPKKADQVGIVAEWLYRTVEMKGLDSLVRGTGSWFTSGSDWLYRNIENGFDRLWLRAGRSLMALSQGVLRREDRGQQKAHHQLQNWLGKLERLEGKREAAPGHWDLIWIPFILIFILIFVLLT